MEIGDAARRHRLSDEDIVHAVRNAIRIVEHPDGLLFIGANRAGVELLEVLARETDEGLVVFHASLLTATNRKRYL